MFWHFWKRRGPKKDEDPSKQILKILDMRPISTRKHERDFGRYLPENMTWIFGNFWSMKNTDGQCLNKLESRGGGDTTNELIIFLGPKQLLSPCVFEKNRRNRIVDTW